MAKHKKRDERVFLIDILESIQKIQVYTQNISEADFEKNTEKQDAVIRRLEIIGEAVKNISDDTRSKNPSIRWREIAGMRDVVIHQYFGVSIGLIWQVATQDLPELESKIERLINDSRTVD